MNKILLLGGTADAIRIAKFCLASLIHSSGTQNRLELIYSLAGVVRKPKLDCEIRVGGFGGWRGLRDYVKDNSVELIVDVTHPYASGVKNNAEKACAETAIPLFRFVRPAWQKSSQDLWVSAETVAEVIALLSQYRSAFFTIGRSAFELLPAKHKEPYTQQQWNIRYARSSQRQLPEVPNNVNLINAIGPFDYDAELKFMQFNNIDVLISKNSGGDAVSAKILAASACGIPVIMLKRPIIIKVKQQFDQLSALETAIFSYISSH